MPRISLYRPEKGKDFYFLDRQISEMFTIGGTDLHLHKYLGPENTDEETSTADRPRYDSVKETNIQDLLFLENRDRKYDADVYSIRGIYNVQDIDFNLSQFGLFLSNDTLYMTVHISDTVKSIGRKIMAGDVLELPHLKDEYALNDYSVALKRFYVVDEINRASEGFSPTWYPHLYRLKLKQIYDGQEFKEILDLPADEDSNQTLRDVLSTFEREMQINEAIVQQAEADSPLSGYETSHLYTRRVAEDGTNIIEQSFPDEVPQAAADRVDENGVKDDYDGYLVGDGLAPNGEVFGFGINFPANPGSGDYWLRTDFLPNKLFRYDGTKWVRQEDSVRMTLSNTNLRQTQKTSFINNSNTSTINGQQVVERQSLSQALKPKADN
jgi:hypothetical protein|tara:strand:+ start:838 stop:1983 length:1146 start_codon:yes stop_codon:yes gene_type:complete